MASTISPLVQLYNIFHSYTPVCTDTRKITKGCLYWALRGERFDGNHFVEDALAQGAAWAITDRKDLVDHPQVTYVPDSLWALQSLARHHRRTWGKNVVALTGSNGKTTTKELLGLALGTKYHTFITPGNFNNHIGLPLSILQLEEKHEVAVIEIGANHAGENMVLSLIAEPDLGVVTNIGKDHLEGFGSLHGVGQAHTELFSYLESTGGRAIVNMDDEYLAPFAKWLENSVTYGKTPSSDVSGSIKSLYPTLCVQIEGLEKEVQTSLFGSVHLSNVLCVLAVCKALHIDFNDASKAIESYQASNNRSQFITCANGHILILDAYNANPSSMTPAIADFANHPAPHKVIVLGDMFELGSHSHVEHESIVKAVLNTSINKVIFVGEEFATLENGYPGPIYLANQEELGVWLQDNELPPSTFYIKGSRGIALEKAFKAWIT